MSPRSPQVTTKAAAASTYAFTTHWRLACVEWKSWAIAGSAVLIDVVLTQTANSGTHTAARVHQARGSGRDAAIGVAAYPGGRHHPGRRVFGVRPGHTPETPPARPPTWRPRRCGGICG